MVLPARYKSRHLLVALPKSYVIFALGFKLPEIVTCVALPKLVMLGCAAVDNVPEILFAAMLLSAFLTTIVLAVEDTEVSNPSTLSQFKLATTVLDETVKGAVPVDTLEISLDPDISPDAFKLFAFVLPLTVSTLVVKFQVKFGEPPNKLSLLN
jgi:hypothetical protein